MVSSWWVWSDVRRKLYNFSTIGCQESVYLLSFPIFVGSIVLYAIIKTQERLLPDTYEHVNVRIFLMIPNVYICIVLESFKLIIEVNQLGRYELKD